MLKRKIAIVGSDGQLSYDLIKIFSEDNLLVKLKHNDLDVTDIEACRRVFKKEKPQVVINTAAFHRTGDCELNPKKSFLVNAIGAYNCAKASKEVGAVIIFISTDYVFDGTKKYFNENDLPNPLNVYGTSKLAGEALTKIGNPQHYIVRTSWLYGKKKSGKGHNFVYLMLEKAQKEEAVRVVNDQFGCPTYTSDLSFKIKQLVDKKAPFGIYNIVNSGYCSWYKFAKEILRLSNKKVNLVGYSSKENPSPFARPKYSILSTKKIEKSKLGKLRPWDKALKSFLKELKR